MDQKLTFLDALNLVILLFEIRSEVQLSKQATNNDVLREIRKDTDSILRRLEKLEVKNAE